MEMEKELDDNSNGEEVEDLEEENNIERPLDVKGLARAYKKISSASNDGFYKDVLCIAISSLCG